MLQYVSSELNFYIMSRPIYLDKIKTKIENPVILNIIWLSFDKALRIVIALGVGVWIARYLGPSQWGELNYVLAIVSILTTVTNLGMDSFLVKSILEKPDQKDEILGTAFFTRLFIIPIVFCFAMLFFYITNAETRTYILFAFLSLNFIIAPLDLIDLVFQSKLQSKLTVISKNTAYIVGAVIKIYLLLSEKSIYWFAAVMGLETTIAYLLLIYNYQKRYNLLDWQFSKTLVKDLLSTGWPFIIANLTVILYMRIDQLMIGSLSGKAELGLFSSAVRITEIFIFIPAAMSSSYLPALVKLKKEGSNEDFIKRMQVFFNWMVKISIAISIVVSLLSSQIIQLLFGTKFSDAYQILIIHVWSLIPMFLGVASSQYLVIENLQKYSLYKTFIGLLLNVILNLLLIPSYGAFGSALATLLSYFTSAIFSSYFFHSTRLLFNYQIKSFQNLFVFEK